MDPAREQSALRRLAPAGLVFALAFAAFLPALRNGFVNWDDQFNFLLNPNYRGLGRTQLAWMFGDSYRYGHYIPLTWLTLGLDYRLWGMEPFGYHLTSVLLHALNAAVFCLVSRRLLVLAAPERAGSSPEALDFAAAFAALLFAVHPLRVESVAWITERRDVLSGLFYLLSVLFYLRAAANGAGRGRWLAGAWCAFALSLLSKLSGAALPLVLAVLDVYPLRRLPADPRRWLAKENRGAWLDKLPFCALSAGAIAVGFVAAGSTGSLTSLRDIGPLGRAALVAFTPSFYLWKSLAPFGLLPLYQLTHPIDPLQRRFLLSAAVVAALSFLLYRARRRFPAGLAAWAAYLAALVPVMGFVTHGDILAADRYTYLPCLAGAVLSGGALLRPGRRTAAWRGAACLVLLALAALTWRQEAFWKDSTALWSRVLSVRPRDARARHSLGMALHEGGKLPEAVEQYREALRIVPAFPGAHAGLARALYSLGRVEEAIAHYEEALRLLATIGNGPRMDFFVRHLFVEVHYNLGQALHERGRVREAMAHYREALRIGEERYDRELMAFSRNNLGVALEGIGRAPEAAAQFEAALRLEPGFARARENLERARP